LSQHKRASGDDVLPAAITDQPLLVVPEQQNQSSTVKPSPCGVMPPVVTGIADQVTPNIFMP